MRSKGLCVPELSDEGAETECELRRSWHRELLQQEEVSNWRYMGQELDYDVQVVVGLDVIHTHKA